ncbi:MAG: GNAT family N-acetyltransferase [Actinomycetota bacterium]
MSKRQNIRGAGSAGPQNLRVHAVTADRWDDLHALFGDRGGYSNCWCMWWRLKSSEFDQGVKGSNRRAFKKLVDSGHRPGLLAYDAGEPVGWCSVGPRADFGRVLRSPMLRPEDDELDVWSVVCFFIDRKHRGSGVATALLKEAIDFARTNGARWLEAYPVDTPKVPDRGAATLFTGVVSLFESHGFEEVVRRKDARPVMRRRLVNAE